MVTGKKTTSKKSSQNQSAAPQGAGPQGTMIFSAEEIQAALDEKAQIKMVSGGDGSMLVGINAPFEGQLFHLTKETQTLGRKNEQDIVLDDPSISSLHAQITKENDHWKIINLLSSNGTFVNGKKISIANLKDGDTLRLGQAEFYFKSVADVSSSSKTPAKPSITLWLVVLAIAAAITSYFVITSS